MNEHDLKKKEVIGWLVGSTANAKQSYNSLYYS